MKKSVSKRKKGFTIIEVSLVLAIAGLIFLMVFVALPQLQRQQRDSRRRDDILMFLENVKKYQTNNRGALPTDWSTFKSKYLDDSFTDPDGFDYALQAEQCDSVRDVKCIYDEPDTMDHFLYIFTKATCKGSEAFGSSNPRNIAVLYKLEGAGMYCANT